MEVLCDSSHWWNHRRSWIFTPPNESNPEIIDETTSPKQSHWTNNYFAPNVNILQVSIFSGRMEALKVAIAVQREVEAAIETHYFRPLQDGVVVGLDPETEAPKPTLAEQTRYIRLQSLLTVLKELIPLELRIQNWLEGLEENLRPAVASEIEKTLRSVEEVSHKIPDEWGTCGSPTPGNVTSEEDVLVEVMTSPTISLERRINFLHRSLETILSAVRQLLTNVIDRNLDLVSSSPCDIMPNDIGSLLLKLPQRYILVEDGA